MTGAGSRRTQRLPADLPMDEPCLSQPEQPPFDPFHLANKGFSHLLQEA